MSNIEREELLVQIRHMFESAWQDGTMHESPKYVRRDHLFTEKTLKLIDQYTQGKVDEAVVATFGKLLEEVGRTSYGTPVYNHIGNRLAAAKAQLADIKEKK